MSSVLIGNELHKTYGNEENLVHVLKGVNVDIKQGELVGIVGPSGAGKSTLIHILSGLDQPSDGEVQFQGEDVYRLSDKKRSKLRAESMGFIFQFYHLLAEFSVFENVIMPAFIKAKKGKPADFQLKAHDLISQVGLSHRLQHKPNQLSGGEQQRVAIARALMNQPEILFCDEPTGNLDSTTGKEIIDLLVNLNKDKGQTCVIVTHDDQLAKVCHRTIHLVDGKIQQD